MIRPIMPSTGINNYYAVQAVNPQVRAAQEQEQRVNTANTLERSPEQDCFVSSTDEVSFGGRINYEKVAKGLRGTTDYDASKVVERLNAGKNVVGLTEAEMLNVWIHRFYGRIKEARLEFMARLNDMCKGSVIQIKKDDKLLGRTISVHTPRELGTEFQISNPDPYWGNIPAAVARGGVDEKFNPTEDCLRRIINDKVKDIKNNPFIVTNNILPDSSLFVIETQKNIEIAGIDCRELGDCKGLFGSPVFQGHTDEYGRSSEVLMPHETKVRLMEKLPRMSVDAIDEKTKINYGQFGLLTERTKLAKLYN